MIFFFQKCNSLTKHGTWSMDDSWKWRKSSKKDCSTVMPTGIHVINTFKAVIYVMV